MLTLGPRGTSTLTYKLIAEPTDVRGAGIFTQDVTLQAQDESFRSLGGARIVLGIKVLPSARNGLAGYYKRNDGHADVDLGDLRPGIAPVLLNLNVARTGYYDLNVTSANLGRPLRGSREWYVPTSM